MSKTVKIYCEMCYSTYDEDISSAKCPHGVIETATIAVRADGLERVCADSVEAESFLGLPRRVVRELARPSRGEMRVYYWRGNGFAERPERPIALRHGTKLKSANGVVFKVVQPLRLRVAQWWRRVWWRWLGLLDQMRGDIDDGEE